MKRCPHCRAQDHEDAIICKNCMRYFNAPVEKPAVAAAPADKSAPAAGDQPAPAKSRPRRSRSALGGFIRLLFFLGLVVYGIGWNTVQEWIWPPDSEIPPVSDAAATTPPAPAPSPPPPDSGAVPTQPAQTSDREPVAGPASGTTPAPASEPAPSTTPEAAAVDAGRAAQTAVREGGGAPRPGAATRSTRKPPANAPRPEPAPPPRPEATAVVPERAPAPEPPAPPPPKVTPQLPRVGGAIKAPRKVRDVSPDYPTAARRARIEGIVIIEATIDARGRVQQTRVLRSIPQLDEAALDAVRQWEYEPTVIDGVATPVIMTVTVRFALR
jgi:TonB family protein